MTTYAGVLALLALAFLGRVAGQLAVVLWQPDFLPPMEEWYSGLLPYRFLLPSQLAILLFQALLSWQLWRGRGPLTRRSPRFGRGLK